MLHLPGMPPGAPGNNEGAHTSEIEGVPPGYVYICTSLSGTEYFDLDAYAMVCKRDTDFNPNLLTDEWKSTV